MIGGAPNPKAVGIGFLVILVLSILGVYIYSAIIGTKDLSWQTAFFMVITVFIGMSISGYVGFKIGQHAVTN